jgi:hypothetical protein
MLTFSEGILNVQIAPPAVLFVQRLGADARIVVECVEHRAAVAGVVRLNLYDFPVRADGACRVAEFRLAACQGFQDLHGIRLEPQRVLVTLHGFVVPIGLAALVAEVDVRVEITRVEGQRPLE